MGANMRTTDEKPEADEMSKAELGSGSIRGEIVHSS